MFNDDLGRWSFLVRGTKLLIQECDPVTYSNSFERSMLESQRAWFVRLMVSQGQTLFAHIYVNPGCARPQ